MKKRLLFCLLLLQAMPLFAAEWIYTVRPGDNLWNLTERYMVSLRYWQPLKQLNNIAEPRRMRPGSKLRMPIAWSKVRYVDARVIAVQGRVEILSPGEDVRLATADMRLRRQDRLQTDPEASLLLEFSDGSRLLLAGDSSAELQRLQGFGDGEVGDSRVGVSHGRIESKANPRQIRGTRFEISTPSAVTAVRGTGFRVAVERSDGRSRVEVIEGKVEVIDAAGSQAVSGGFALLSDQAGTAAKPVKLLPAPALSGTPQLVEDVSFAFQLAPLSGASAYRLQVAASDTLTVPAFDRRFSDGRIRVDVPELADGFYVMKVRGVDARGVEGVDAVHRFELNARPAAPFLISPPRDSASVNRQPLFQWAEPEEAVSYRFQLASDSQMEKILLDLPRLTAREYQSQSLDSGRYFWRVTAYDSDGKAGPVGSPQPFRVLPDAPDAAAPEVDDTGLNFHWRPGRADQRYRFQMASDAEFTRLLQERETAASQVRLPQPDTGIYFMRVKTIDPDGAEGPYGRAQRIEITGNEDHGWFVLIPVVLGLLIAL